MDLRENPFMGTILYVRYSSKIHLAMAKHDVRFTVPKRPLGKADINFEIMADGEKLGTLAISQGAVVWFARNNTKGHKMNWSRFDELMQEFGRRAERR